MEKVKKIKPTTKVERKTTFSIPRLVKDDAPVDERLIPAPLDCVSINKMSIIDDRTCIICINNCIRTNYINDYSKSHSNLGYYFISQYMKDDISDTRKAKPINANIPSK